MYSAPLREQELPHRREREEWARRLREEHCGEAPPSPGERERRPVVSGLSGDAALAGLLLFLLSDKTKGDVLLIGILIYLLLN